MTDRFCFGLLFLLLSLFVPCSRAALNSETELANLTGISPAFLFGRDLPAGQCSSTQPCADGSCCNGITGFCGRDDDHCKAGVCSSNCDAKSDCGRGAAVPGTTCPLNVCCGPWGYCGTTDDFCSVANGCQSNCPQPGSTGRNTGDVRKLVIGYWEAWSLTTEGCSARTIDDVPVSSLTHLNLAFAYIEPKTFNIVPMARYTDTIFSEITNLKQKAPGLKIWISLGGWTYSDNDTDTQPVWGELASSQVNRATFTENLYKFMKSWGFDGVDLDWEYPGAPDRGGTPADSQNYVSLLATMYAVFQASGSNYGISITAPTSYWYLRWFRIDQMYQYVNWINLMTYDLHGSWDSPEDYIGSYVYAHTNLTEIEDALNLFWRMQVPADRINLGLGFYGRSYTLQDTSCSSPGCPFSDPGVAGECTGTPGVLSYDEIQTYKKEYSLTPYYDETAGVKYLIFQQNQWVSYDDQQTLQVKVDFANKQGLLGLFIWAIDLDDSDHSALQAVLGGKLGVFADQNGYNNNNNSDWTSVSGNECSWSNCGQDCSPGLRSAGAQQYCGIGSDKQAQLQTLCCPLASTPDPSTCHWSGDQSILECRSACNADEIEVISSTEPIINGEHVSCFWGFAQYCCKGQETFADACSWTDCKGVKNGHPTDSNVCGDRVAVTTKQGTCSGFSGNVYCCDKSIDTSSCYWYQGITDLWHGSCYHSDICPNSGSTHMCEYPIPQYTGVWQWQNADIAFCCNTNGMTKTFNLPVPLADLFPTPGPSSDTQKFDIEVDQTMGGQRPSSNSINPNDNSFGFYIMSGPQDEITTVAKRDGSHWELFDCDNTIGEKRQTVKAVCTDTSDDSNCGIIFEGGVPLTVVEMPPDCGPGKYAVAVSMERSEARSRLKRKLEKRGLHEAPVYDFTFDYDFSPIHARDQSNVLLRIDYSDDPGYWSEIVDSPGATKHKRDLEIELEFGGNPKAWLEAQWHKEKRSMPLDELHKRWWSGDVREWWDRQRNIDVEWTGIRHRVHDTYTVLFFDEDLSCPAWGTDIFDQLYFKSWADVTIDLQASAGVTIIGNLGDLSSFKESSAWFRTSGSVDATLNFQAKGTLSFHTGQVEMFGLENFGASFRVPGIVTIGPNFRILGSLSGDATLELNAQYRVNFASWDYSMRYPVPSGESDTPAAEATPSEPTMDKSHEPFSWDIDANGQLTAHITPKVEFGIVFDSSQISNAALSLGVDSYTRIYAEAHVGSTTPFYYCYGMDGGATLFAQVEAPTIFKTSFSNYYPLKPYTYDIIEKTCSGS